MHLQQSSIPVALSRPFQRPRATLLTVAASLAFAAHLLLAGSAFAATVIVTDPSDTVGPPTLRQALIDVNAGDTIEFNLLPNTIITVTSQLAVTKIITIDGTTATNLSVSGGGTTRVFNVTAPATFIGFTVMNGNAGGSGGGLSSTSDITLTSMQFLSNTAAFDGGGASVNGAVLLTNGLFQSNTSTGFSGGGLYALNTLTLTGTQFLSNTAGGFGIVAGVAGGGGAHVVGAAQLTNGLFQNNSTNSAGGGLYANTTLTLTGVQFLSNTAISSGGGAYIGGAFVSGAAQLTNGLFQNNSTNNSGGGLNANSTLTLTGTQFLSNTAQGFGGGAFVSGAAQLTNGLFQSNTSLIHSGGGLYANSTLVLTGTQFLGNTSVGSGGGAYANSTLTLTGTQFLSNTASQYGGGAYADGAVQLTNGLFQNNSASDSGGGLFALDMLTLTDTQFLSNTATPGTGGGAFVHGAAQLTNGLFQSNFSFAQGGGLSAGSMLTLIGTQFLSNTSAGSSGGGADVSGATHLTHGLFQNNRALEGGGLCVNGTLVLTDTQFLSNTAINNGGGAFVANDAAELTHGLFQNNSAGGFGGGLYAGSTLTLTDTQFLSNAATNNGGGAFVANDAAELTHGLFQNNSAGGFGGGLYAGSTLTLTDTQFLSNMVDFYGGGVYHNAGTGRLVNVLFARNVATSSLGSGLYLNRPDSFQIVHTTFAGSAVGSGSAIYISTGTVGITNTIITNYAIGISNTSGTVAQNYNLFFANGADTQGAVTSGNNNLAGDPAFANPSANDFHLTAPSLAVDHGIDAGINTDFEGQPRPQGSGFDIGFDESPFSIAILGLMAVNDSPTILGNPTAFTASIISGSNVSYTWSFGDGPSTSTGMTSIHTYTTASNYIATVTATNGFSTTSASTVVTITTPPPKPITATLTSDSPTPLNQDTHLTATLLQNTALVVTYTLNYGDGTPLVIGTTTAATLPFTFRYTAAGTYTALITATNGFSTTSAGTVVTITAPPTPRPITATLTSDSPTPMNQDTHLTATLLQVTALPLIYTLNYGDGSPVVIGTTTAATLPFTHIYTAAGNYTASITATNGFSTTSASTVVTITAIPPPTPRPITATLTSDSPTPVNQDTHLTATLLQGTALPVTYTLNYGDGTPVVTGTTTAATLPFVYTYTVAGSYTALITATNGFSTTSASTALTITAPPPTSKAITATLTSDSPTLLGQATHLTATLLQDTALPVTYILNYGDGTPIVTGTTSVNTLPFTRIYTAAGSYTATITATNGFSVTSAATLVRVISNNGLFGSLTSQLQDRLITYTFIVTNASTTQPALNVIISGSVPANARLSNAGTALGFTTGGDYGTGYVQSSAAVTLPPGESVQITWTVEVTALTGDITTFGHATSNSSTINLSVTNHIYRLFMPVIRKNAVLIQ